MAADFLIFSRPGHDALMVRIVRGQWTRSPDGYGKSRWQGTTAPLTRADETALRAMAGTPSASESVRSFLNGALLSDLPPVTAAGEAFGAAEGVSGTVTVELRIGDATPRHTLVGGEPATRNAVAITARER